VDIQKSWLEMTGYLYGPDFAAAELQRKTLEGALVDFGAEMLAMGVGRSETLPEYFARKVKETG
jgi:hypothetical protein